MVTIDYPRPRMYRDGWLSLDGIWEFDFFDDYPITKAAERISGSLFHTIRVPFTYQTEYSGINDKAYHPCMVYRKSVVLDQDEPKKRLLLHFGAVDYKTDIWIDQKFIGSHTGGYTPFTFDITDMVVGSTFTLAVQVVDTLSLGQVRGKQSWCNPVSCWYTPVSGIWQSVWLEYVPDTYISYCSAKNEMTNLRNLHVEVELSDIDLNSWIACTLVFDGQTLQTLKIPCKSQMRKYNAMFNIADPKVWDTQNPNLYTIEISYCKEDGVCDLVQTYAALRTVSWNSDGFCINAKPQKLRLVLHQGYWPESGYSPPKGESFRDDILLMKQMGFSGCRMHMKFEDPRFLYWADVLGFYVWAEAPAFYSFSKESASLFRSELLEIVHRDCSSPCIITWVLCNESWGLLDIEDNASVRAWLFGLTSEIKKLTGLPVIDNDGWEHVCEEMPTFHSYEHSIESLQDDWLAAKCGKPAGILKKRLYVGKELDSPRVEEPMLLTEFGGLSYVKENDTQDNWGYGTAYRSNEAFFEAVKKLMNSVEEIPDCAGWCYTQFCDVYQEKNGLVFANRSQKFPIAWLQEWLAQLS